MPATNAQLGTGESSVDCDSQVKIEEYESTPPAADVITHCPVDGLYVQVLPLASVYGAAVDVPAGTLPDPLASTVAAVDALYVSVHMPAEALYCHTLP